MISETNAEVQSEITRIFDDYYNRLDEISRVIDPSRPEPGGEEDDGGDRDSFESKLSRLVEIIVEKEAVTPAEEAEAADLFREFEAKLQEAKALIAACENELREKYGDLDDIIAYAQQQLDNNGMGLRDYIPLI